MDGDQASVDSELTLLYRRLKKGRHPLAGPLANPFDGHRRTEFSHPAFAMYLVTRLTGYEFQDVKRMIDRCQAAQNQGKFVFDLREADSTQGNDWLRNAGFALPPERVLLDSTSRVLQKQSGVIAYASWGSNDRQRKERHLGFEWLPGAIMTEFVSTNGRTFRRPPDSWNISPSWKNPAAFFAGSPQTLAADYIHEGVSGASAHVYEPYLQFTPRPEYVFPAYYRGRNLAESFYVGIPALSWQNIVIGDPLCTIGPPARKIWVYMP
jgi:uncharacterized protein (TIGR03790 family)